MVRLGSGTFWEYNGSKGCNGVGRSGGSEGRYGVTLN